MIYTNTVLLPAKFMERKRPYPYSAVTPSVFAPLSAIVQRYTDPEQWERVWRQPPRLRNMYVGIKIIILVLKAKWLA